MKQILIAALAVLTLASCKKNQQSDQLKTTENQAIPPATAPAPPTQQELIKAAQSKPLTTIALNENHFDFGKIKNGEKVQHVYEITNTGKNPLVISEVKPGCGCTAPEFTKDPILPGKTGKVTLSFDSSSFHGLVNKEASIYANVEKAPIIVTFSADIQN